MSLNIYGFHAGLEMAISELKTASLRIHLQYSVRPVASGGAREACAPPLFGRSVNPISTRGGTYYPHPVIHAPPDFQTLRRPCYRSNFWKSKVLLIIQKVIFFNI